MGMKLPPDLERRVLDMAEPRQPRQGTVLAFTIPDYRPPTPNVLFRATLRRRMVLERECKVFVKHYGANVTSATCKRRVSVVVTLTPRQRIPDVDADGWKVLLDALVAAGFLMNDSRKWCETVPWTYERGKRNQTLVILEDVR
jgi:hypothetical protein